LNKEFLRGGKNMKNKSVVFFVCMLVMITAFSAVVTTGKQEQSSLNQSSMGHLGGLLTQLPFDPGLKPEDWWANPSALGTGWQCYENFNNIAGPIRSIHWWGISAIDDGPFPWPPGDPEGMTFNITFYKDNNTKVGDMVLSYSNVKPTITATGVFYPDYEDLSLQLYFFEYDLTPYCNLSNGWVSIFSTGSDNNCSFVWMGSIDGDDSSRYLLNGHWAVDLYDLSLVLSDGEDSDMSIVDVTGGSGVTVLLKNNGNTMMDNYPVKFVVKGGLLKKIAVNAGGTISDLAPGDTTSLQTGSFFGLGKITIFVVGDGIAAYKHGIQLLMYTIIQ
jgi:hypothetical protein